MIKNANIRGVIQMEIRVLKYFLAIAQQENITKAAENLHISQPTLSKQMMELEDELGKTLLIRGKRKVTLTDDGKLLRKRAEQIVLLCDKTKNELSGNDTCLSGEIGIGGNPTKTVLNAAAQLKNGNPDLRFQFFSSDAIDVSEQLDSGHLDVAILLEPVDGTKYDYLSLPDSSKWGVLMLKNNPFAKKDFIEKAELPNIPLVFHRRQGLQSIISHWADVDIEKFNISATYNVINGSPSKFVKSGLGCFLTTEDLLSECLESDICFKPLNPKLEMHYALVWKKYTPLSKSASEFLNLMKSCI